MAPATSASRTAWFRLRAASGIPQDRGGGRSRSLPSRLARAELPARVLRDRSDRRCRRRCHAPAPPSRLGLAELQLVVVREAAAGVAGRRDELGGFDPMRPTAGHPLGRGERWRARRAWFWGTPPWTSVVSRFPVAITGLMRCPWFFSEERVRALILWPMPRP